MLGRPFLLSVALRNGHGFEESVRLWDADCSDSLFFSPQKKIQEIPQIQVCVLLIQWLP